MNTLILIWRKIQKSKQKNTFTRTNEKILDSLSDPNILKWLA